MTREEFFAHALAKSDDEFHPEWDYTDQAKSLLSIIDGAGIALVPVERDVLTFARAILHGDEKHRAWLMDAAMAFVAGQELPPCDQASPMAKEG